MTLVGVNVLFAQGFGASDNNVHTLSIQHGRVHGGLHKCTVSIQFSSLSFCLCRICFAQLCVSMTWHERVGAVSVAAFGVAALTPSVDVRLLLTVAHLPRCDTQQLVRVSRDPM